MSVVAEAGMVGSARIRVRPLRLAYLVDPNDRQQVRDAMRLSSSLWGGAYSPIIPLHRRPPAAWRREGATAPSAKAMSQGLIEAFDPDVLVRLAAGMPDYLDTDGVEVIRPGDVWQGFLEGKFSTPSYGIGIFELLKDIYNDFFRYKAKYPVRVVIPRLPRELGLFWASFLGELPPDLVPALERGYAEPLDIETPTVGLDSLEGLLGGDVFFPRRISGHGTAVEGPNASGRNAAAFYMDATKVDDIIDLWNLRATGRRVLPLPVQLVDIPEYRVVIKRYLAEHRVHWRNQPQHCDGTTIIRSRNTSFENMERFADGLEMAVPAGDSSRDGFYTLQRWYPRLWDEWARDKDGGVGEVFGEGDTTIELGTSQGESIRLPALRPAFVKRTAYANAPTFANEIEWRFYGAVDHLAEVYPPSSGEHFQRAIADLASTAEWRVGRNGLVRLVEHDFAEARALPLAEPLLFAWLADHGWDAKLSSAGKLAKQVFQRLGGRSGLLKNEVLLRLLEHMTGGMVGATEATDSPENTRKAGPERTMAVSEIKQRLATSARSATHERLLELGVFETGLQVQCPSCSRKSWYSLDALKNALGCPKCLNTFSATGNVESGHWHYKSTGPFSVPGYAEGAYSSLLTLEAVCAHRLFLRTTPVLSFTARNSEGKCFEADVAFFWSEVVQGGQQTGLAFGECKTFGEFKKADFDRMRQLASNFPGAVLVFSTLKKRLSAREVAGITRVAKAGRKYWKPERPINPVLVLTGVELFSDVPPPYCWEEPEFRHGQIHGLLALCEATQKRYLNLPSWYEDWRVQWAKERARSSKKQRAATKAVSTDEPKAQAAISG